MPILFSGYRKCWNMASEEVGNCFQLPTGLDPVAPLILSGIDNIMDALSRVQIPINIDTRRAPYRIQFRNDFVGDLN